MIRRIVFLFLILSSALMGASFADGAESDAALCVWPDRFDSAEHPDRARLHVTPPDWAMFDHQTQFMTLRGFPSENDEGRDFAQTIEQYQNAELGRIIWPHAATIFFNNLGELADEIKARDLFLFDIWGYVPGSGPWGTGDWTQFRADPAQFRLLEEKLGDHWLGMDNGEQDGRYIGGYAPAAEPISGDRFAQYLRFQRHFERLGDELGNRLTTLVSLNFGHYFLKEGVYSLIGAETAQALPNSQVYYSWIRGAGKQYGVLWFGNASIFNRWGWKVYPKEFNDQAGPTKGTSWYSWDGWKMTPGFNDKTGPTKGTSLSLMKRLLYSHILYNSAAVGFESGWFIDEELGPIGRIQQSAARWLKENGDPGTQVTPVGVLCDFSCGWSFPRHLYTGNSYRVWGNIPYDAGDYLTHGLFELLYPRYQDSSYYHDESGFLTATPYGDCADALLTDAPSWLLARYPLILAADKITPDAETLDKLTRYVEKGGRLVITAGNLAAAPNGLCGVSASSETTPFDTGTPILWSDAASADFASNAAAADAAAALPSAESRPFEAHRLTLPENATILAQSGETILAAETPFGHGVITVLAPPFGVTSKRSVSGPIPNAQDQPLANPFPMLDFVQTIYQNELNRTTLFDVGAGLGSVVCRKDEGVYTVGVFNNTLGELPFEMKARFGKIEKTRELPTDESLRNDVGFLPEGFENAAIGENTDTKIAGGTVRIFEVTLSGDRVTAMERGTMPAAPKNRFLALRGQTPIKEAILARPTFFQHYDGALIDWKYLDARSAEEIERESGWIRRQKLRLLVDFSSGVNLYPDLRLIQNDPPEYERSMQVFRSVIDKGAALGAEEIMFTTHRTPETNYSAEQTQSDTVAAIQELCARAAERNMTVSLRIETNAPIPDAAAACDFADALGAENFRLAPTLFVANAARGDAPLAERLYAKRSRLLLAGWEIDENNTSIWTNHQPIHQMAAEIRDAINIPPETPVIFDAVYRSTDEEYQDAAYWEKYTAEH